MLKNLLLIWLVSVLFAKGEKLPPCPTSIDFFPQNLPMHCRMPRNVEYPGPPSDMPTNSQPIPSPFYQSLPSDKQPIPVPVPPIPPGFPFPGSPPGGFPVPMPMMPMPGPSHKLPVIVMPFYSPDPSFKKGSTHQAHLKPHVHSRRPQPDSTDIDTDTGTDSDCSNADSSNTSSDTFSDTSAEHGWWNRARKARKGSKRSGRRSNRNRKHKYKKKQKKTRNNLLTPVLQYVTKDGYVIFEKKISKDEAKDWLRMKQEDGDNNPNIETEKSPEDDGRPVENVEKKLLSHVKEQKNREHKNTVLQNKSIELDKTKEEGISEKPHGHKKHHPRKSIS